MKHAARVERNKKRKHTLRPNPLKLPHDFSPHDSLTYNTFIDMTFDQALLQVLKASGIRDALFNAIKNAPPKDEEENTDIIQ